MKIKDITPKSMLCGLALGCPAIFKTDRDTYILVGKNIPQILAELEGRVGPDETAVEIPAALLAALSGSTTEQLGTASAVKCAESHGR